MRRLALSLTALVWLASTAAAQQPIVAQPQAEPPAAQFAGVLQRALKALAAAERYALDVESVWGAVDDQQGLQGGSRYRLVVDGTRFRVEVQSQAAQAAELVCVNDGQRVTTWLPARKLYSQHAVDSPEASLESNKMLATSLQGSAIDILLQPDVAGFVSTQAGEVRDRGTALLGGVPTRHFEVQWQGARVELWFAAEGDPLLLQFTRTVSVPTGENEAYEMFCTARFRWRLKEQPAAGTFAIDLPREARQVKDIYAALSGDEEAARIGRPLPKVQLARLDGTPVELVAAADKRATVLIFWATWNAASVEDMPAVSQFVRAYRDRSVAFYAINVGEAPGVVRRFTAESPLQSTVLLDPRSQASSALRVSELPAVVVVGPDNTVREILYGAAKDLQAELSQKLEALLNQPPANTARRPSEATK
jgi:thiol-disulfide isomerase/thioredoxin